MSGKKVNIRSLRFTDEVADLIDRQVGENFSQKFENLVTRAFYEVPAAEAELEALKKQIEAKRWKLGELSKKAQKLEAITQDIEWRLMNLSETIARAEKEAI